MLMTAKKSSLAICCVRFHLICSVSVFVSASIIKINVMSNMTALCIYTYS